MRLLPALSVTLLIACGSRTGLESPDGAVSSADAPAAPDAPSTPDCGPAPPVGAVRFRVPGVVGRAAVAPDGTLYAPIATPSRGRGLVAIDACGRELWRRTSVEPGAGRTITGGQARLTAAGDVVLSDLTGDASARTLFRYSPTGEARGPYAFSDVFARLVALPAGRGPLVVSQPAGSTSANLDLYDASGARVLRLAGWSNVQECAVLGSVVGCLDGAFDLSSRRLLWSRPFEILDGTLRHALAPALHNGRIYTAFFGVNTYALTATELRTGRELWRRTLVVSTRGQSDLVMGAPVVDASGRIYVYLNVHSASAPTGRLFSFNPDGTPRWTVSAAAGATDYLHMATHVVGDTGVVYLAVGTTVHAINAEAVEVWRASFPEGLSATGPTLSPSGDLLVHTNDDALVAVVTESHGLAASGWPVEHGDARNSNVR